MARLKTDRPKKKKKEKKEKNKTKKSRTKEQADDAGDLISVAGMLTYKTF